MIGPLAYQGPHWNLSRVGFVTVLIIVFVLVYLPPKLSVAITGHTMDFKGAVPETEIFRLAYLIGMLLGLAFIGAASVARLRHAGRPDLLALITLIPGLNLVLWIALCFLPPHGKEHATSKSL